MCRHSYLFSVSLELGNEISFVSCNLGLALLQGEFECIPAFLGDLLNWFLLVDRISADRGMGLLVDGLDLKENEKLDENFVENGKSVIFITGSCM